MRVVLVTGASRGIGREIAVSFGTLPSQVVVNFKKNKAQALKVTEEITKTGGQAFACQADVAKLADVQEMVSQVLRKWKRIDVLINNAGAVNDSLLVRMKRQTWDEVVETNLKGVFNCTQVVSKVMINQRDGLIINISSLAGIRGRIGQSNYAAAKAGVIGFTKSAAKELGEYNITVNAVLPGYLLTDLGRAVPKEVTEQAISENVLGRLSQPAEIAAFIVHLAGMKNVSGQVFNLDSRIY